jgi:hypothetical protein
MRRSILFSLLLLVCLAATAQMQDLPPQSVKVSVDFAHDYTGMNGIAASAEYNFPFNEWLQGGVGLKQIQIAGHPNTALVEEYTRSTTLDFNMLVTALQQGPHSLRLGAGYSFVFYNLRRAYAQYPPFTGTVVVKDPNWNVVDEDSRTGGVSLIGEYELQFLPALSGGVRASLSKAYARHVWLVGPFVAVHF